MLTSRTRAVVLLLAYGVLACAPSTVSTNRGGEAARAAADTADTKVQLRSADSMLADAVRSDGAESSLSALDPTAALLFPGQPILRAADASAPYRARYGAPARYSWRPLHAVASSDGRFGCTVGYSQFINPADTARAGHAGTYITCWRRNAAGQWRIVGHQRNDSPGAAPSDGDAPTLARAPHSSTFSSGSEPLAGARAADSAFAVMGRAAAGPGPAFAQYAAEDGMMFSGEEPRGPVQIAAAFDGYPADRVILWEPKRDFGAGSGGLAFTVGDAVSGFRDPAAGAGTHSKYLTVWRQEPDGRWLYLFDLGSSRP